MRNIPGIKGEDDEQPANSNAGEIKVSGFSFLPEVKYLQSKIIATPISIMSTWWYPRNGKNPMKNVSYS